MFEELSRVLTEQELSNAEAEIQKKWGAEVYKKLDRLLEYRIMSEVGDVESQERQRVVIHYKPSKSFDEFHEEFEALEERYNRHKEVFEVSEFAEFERIADESVKALLSSLREEGVASNSIGEHLKLGNAQVAELNPIQIQAIAKKSNVERIEADKVLVLELDQSAKTVGVIDARSQQLVGTGKNVIVAVLDGEVDSNHPDLKGRVVQKRNYTSEAWGNPSEHGTHVAGIIAGNGQQYKGIAPEAIIWSYKIIPSGNSESEEGFKGADAIEDAVKDGAKVINCSWGVQSAPLDGTSIWAKTAERATKLDVVLVKSAGNRGPDSGTITSPADANGDVIVVGASNHEGTEVTEFSSRGPTADNRPKPDILAPGYQIVAAKPGGTYRKMSGTSMASPHIAGIAALMLERNPQLKPWQIKKLLMDCAKSLESTTDPNVQGKGLVDVVKVMQTAAQPTTPTSEQQTIACTAFPQEKRLVEKLAVSVRNTSQETLEAVKATLVSNVVGVRVVSTQQDYGTLRSGAEKDNPFEVEVASQVKPGQHKLTLQVNFKMPNASETKTQEREVVYEVKAS